MDQGYHARGLEGKGTGMGIGGYLLDDIYQMGYTRK
jgi:hypothetical protein